MKSEIQEKEFVPLGIKAIGDGYEMAIAMTEDPKLVDLLACQAEKIKPRRLLILHTVNNRTWTTDAEWGKEHPDLAARHMPLGFVCAHCHQPVMADPSLSAPETINNIRQLCGCTMMLMAPETLPWWSSLICAAVWNITVGEVKQAHQQHGIIQYGIIK